MKKGQAVFLVAALGILASPGFAHLTIARGGKALAAVVVAEKASETERRAACQ
jgi:hypothetical protein